MSNSKAITDARRISNLPEYLYLKEVRANTSLIGGKIIYDRIEWPPEEYNRRFPKPKLRYATVQLDGTQLPTND